MRIQPTSSAILDVAQTLCQTRGFNGFSYRDIASKLGIKSASIHYHYPSKAQLGEALVVRYRGEFQAKLSKIRAEVSDPKKQIQRFTDAIGALAKDNRKLCLCGMLAADSESLSPGMREQVMGFFEDTDKWLEETFSAGKKSGSFSFGGSPKATAQGYIAALQGMLMCARAFDDAARFDTASNWLPTLLA